MEAVEDHPLEPRAAYEAFKSKNFTSFDKSAGDNLHSYGRADYSLGLALGSLGTKGGKAAHQLETPIDRITRLKCEVDEVEDLLIAYLECTQDKDAVARKDFGADPESLLEEVEILKRQLDAVMADGRLDGVLAGIEAVTARRTAFDVTSRQLDGILHDMASVRPELASADAVHLEEGGPTPGRGGDNAFTYELYSVPSVVPFLESGRLSCLEKRLAEVESLIGVREWEDVGFPFTDLHSGINAIAQRLANLDPQRVEAVGRRLQKLTGDIDRLLQRKEKITSGTAAEEKSVQELYETCEKWRHSAACLPVVIKRLRLLKKLHQEAAAASSRLNALEQQQADLIRTIETTKTNMTALQATVVDNVAWIKQMLGDLQESVDNLASEQKPAATPRDPGASIRFQISE